MKTREQILEFIKAHEPISTPELSLWLHDNDRRYYGTPTGLHQTYKHLRKMEKDGLVTHVRSKNKYNLWMVS